MAKVEELGLAENTIIIFTSDNGPHSEGGADPEYFDSNGPLKGTKRDLYEGGIRVPMIASWPSKIPQNSKSNHVSAFWDIFPTLSEIVDMEAPSDIDGVSFLPTLLGENTNQKSHEYLYWEFHEKGGKTSCSKRRTGKRSSITFLKTQDAPIELYDLAVDIGEENNIAEAHPDIIMEMEKILKDARTPSDIFSFGQDTYLG